MPQPQPSNYYRGYFGRFYDPPQYGSAWLDHILHGTSCQAHRDQSMILIRCGLCACVSFAIPTAFSVAKLAESSFSSDIYHSLTKRQYSGNTYNQLTDGTPCRPISVIYARGTSQSGNVGDAAAIGPVLFNNIASKVGGIGGLAIQGVNYSADIIGFLQGGNPQGTTAMLNVITSTASRCPSTKIVLAGYSQGGQVVYNTAQKLSAALGARITAVVTFGSPRLGQSLGTISPSSIWGICHTGDNICEGGILVTDEHRNYQKDAPAAAQFIFGKV